MGRPRQHDLDDLLDQARSLWTEHGTGGVTIRALSTASGVSNGAIYHSFGSRDGLLAGVWAREADRFLVFQRELVEDAERTGGPTDGLVAAALAPTSYASTNEDGARLLLTADVDQLRTADLPDEIGADLRRLRQELGRLLTELATALWNRRDRAAVTTIRYCVVDLPGTLLLHADTVTDPLATHALERAVRGIAAVPPPHVAGRPARHRS